MSAPTSRLPTPVPRDGGWAVLGSGAHRLWDRGWFGRPVQDGLWMGAAEVLDCHRRRGLPQPSEDWLATALESHPSMLYEAEALGALRYPGQRVILQENLGAVGQVCRHPKTWALRWTQERRPTESEPVAEVRWVREREGIDWDELADWVSAVEAGERIPEILIVDDEHNVVTYHACLVDPSGSLPKPAELSVDARQRIARAWASAKETAGGHWLPVAMADWPLPGIGIDLEGGVWLDDLQSRLVSRVINPTLPQQEGTAGNLAAMLDDLVGRGILVRPGTKYGTRWRGYDGPIDADHAPWLFAPEAEAPTDWAEAILNARLAAGVHKIFVCGLAPAVGRPGLGAREWTYLGIARPPSDARWSNPHRH